MTGARLGWLRLQVICVCEAGEELMRAPGSAWTTIMRLKYLCLSLQCTRLSSMITELIASKCSAMKRSIYI